VVGTLGDRVGDVGSVMRMLCKALHRGVGVVTGPLGNRGGNVRLVLRTCCKVSGL